MRVMMKPRPHLALGDGRIAHVAGKDLERVERAEPSQVLIRVDWEGWTAELVSESEENHFQ